MLVSLPLHFSLAAVFEATTLAMAWCAENEMRGGSVPKANELFLPPFSGHSYRPWSWGFF